MPENAPNGKLRSAFTDTLCVYCPSEHRQRLLIQLRRLHSTAHVSLLASGWLVVEAPIGSPRSAWLGGSQAVRVVVGEEHLTPDPKTARQDLERLADFAVRHPARLHELPGDFCFVVLRDAGHALAVRSCSGIPRLYTFHQDSVTAVGTRLEWLAQVYPRPLQLDTNRLVSDEHALGVAPDHASSIRGISIVPVGHAAFCGHWETPRLVDYWRLERLASNPPPNDVATALGRCLRAELTRHLDPSGDNALLFSGGLDSSLLAGLCGEAGISLDAVTILPPVGHPALLRERYFARLMDGSFREHLVRHLDPDTLLSDIRNHPGSLSPIVASEWQALRHLSHAPHAIVTGWFADECFGHLRAPEVLRTWFPDARTLLRIGSFEQQARSWWRRRRAGRSPFQTEGLTVPPLYRRDAAPDFVGWLRATTWMPRPELPAERLRLHRKLTDIGGAYAETAAGLSARVIAPFASRGVVELAATTPVRDLYHGGRAKLPLRRLARDHLPTNLANRGDKGDWGLPETPRPPPPIQSQLAHVLDTHYLQDHPTISLDEVGTILWVEALERGRVRIEHDRQTIWP